MSFSDKTYASEKRKGEMDSIFLNFKSKTFESDFMNFFYGENYFTRGVLGNLALIGGITMFLFTTPEEEFIPFLVFMLVVWFIMTIVFLVPPLVRNRMILEVSIGLMVLSAGVFQGYAGGVKGLQFPHSGIKLTSNFLFEFCIWLVIRPRLKVIIPASVINCFLSLLMCLVAHFGSGQPYTNSVLLLCFFLPLNTLNFLIVFYVVNLSERQLFFHLFLVKKRQVRLLSEHEKTTLLLQNVLPENVRCKIELNKSGGSCKIQTISCGSIIQCDLVDFTAWTSCHGSAIILSILNKYFSFFDTLCLDLGLEKLKSCGDSFTAACFDHESTKSIVLLGLGIIRSVELVNEMYDQAHQTFFNSTSVSDRQIRIGVATGSYYIVVMMGRISRNLNMDLFGTLTKKAEAIEEKAQPNTVLVDHLTYKHSRNEFEYKNLKEEDENFWGLDAQEKGNEALIVDEELWGKLETHLKKCCELFFEKRSSTSEEDIEEEEEEKELLIIQRRKQDLSSSRSSCSSTSSSCSSSFPSNSSQEQIHVLPQQQQQQQQKSSFNKKNHSKKKQHFNIRRIQTTENIFTTPNLPTKQEPPLFLSKVEERSSSSSSSSSEQEQEEEEKEKEIVKSKSLPFIISCVSQDMMNEQEEETSSIQTSSSSLHRNSSTLRSEEEEEKVLMFKWKDEEGNPIFSLFHQAEKNVQFKTQTQNLTRRQILLNLFKTLFITNKKKKKRKCVPLKRQELKQELKELSFQQRKEEPEPEPEEPEQEERKRNPICVSALWGIHHLVMNEHGLILPIMTFFRFRHELKSLLESYRQTRFLNCLLYFWPFLCHFIVWVHFASSPKTTKLKMKKDPFILSFMMLMLIEFVFSFILSSLFFILVLISYFLSFTPLLEKNVSFTHKKDSFSSFSSSSLSFFDGKTKTKQNIEEREKENESQSDVSCSTSSSSSYDTQRRKRNSTKEEEKRRKREWVRVYGDRFVNDKFHLFDVLFFINVLFANVHALSLRVQMLFGIFLNPLQIEYEVHVYLVVIGFMVLFLEKNLFHFQKIMFVVSDVFLFFAFLLFVRYIPGDDVYTSAELEYFGAFLAAFIGADFVKEWNQKRSYSHELTIWKQEKKLIEQKEHNESLIGSVLPLKVVTKMNENRFKNYSQNLNNAIVIMIKLSNFHESFLEQQNAEDLIFFLFTLWNALDGIILPRRGNVMTKKFQELYMLIRKTDEKQHDSLRKKKRKLRKEIIETVKMLEKCIQKFDHMTRHPHKKNKKGRSIRHLGIGLRCSLTVGDIGCGILGTHRFIFDVWGDMINLCARLNSNAKRDGQIVVSDENIIEKFERLNEDLMIEGVGRKVLKGKGFVQMSTLSSLPERKVKERKRRRRKRTSKKL